MRAALQKHWRSIAKLNPRLLVGMGGLTMVATSQAAFAYIG